MNKTLYVINKYLIIVIQTDTQEITHTHQKSRYEIVRYIPRRCTTANFTNTCVTPSRSDGSADAACAPVKCKIQVSSEDVVDDSSSYNYVAYESAISTILSGNSLSYFGKSPVNKEVTDIGKQISEIGHRIFNTLTILIINEVYYSMNVIKNAEVDNNEMQQNSAYNPLQKKSKWKWSFSK